VQWYSSTGLRPYLNSLESDSTKDAFLTDYEDALKIAYPAQGDGNVLFPFVRIFFVARKM
jgi:trans-aconitate 2-methyltransferase